MRCRDACPVKALGSAAYPGDLTDRDACSERSEELFRRHISPCGLCIRACPVGEDRELYRRTDPSLYDEGDPAHERLRRAWKHVQSYGGG
jgi:epoxyqueuosine reductase